MTNLIRDRPLPVTIVPGMSVVDAADAPAAEVIGLTEAYCICRFASSGALAVRPWSEIAVGNLCPADVLLPADVTENDRQNALATVLRELLLLEQFGLTDKQLAALEEAAAILCAPRTR